MNRLGRVVPPKRHILRDISLSFFPGAKIGVLGLNGSGKSTLLKIMAGVDKEFEGEARPQPGIKIGFLAQEPALDPQKNVRGDRRGRRRRFARARAALQRDQRQVRRAARRRRDERSCSRSRRSSRTRSTRSAAGSSSASSRSRPTRCGCRPGTRTSRRSRAASGAALRCAVCCCRSPTCCCSTSRRTISTRNPSRGSSGSSRVLRRHRHRGDSRPLLPRQRRRLDPRARSRPRHSVAGQLLLLARAEGSAARDRGEAGRPRGSARSRPSSSGCARIPALGARRARRASRASRSSRRRNSRSATRRTRSTSRRARGSATS